MPKSHFCTYAAELKRPRQPILEMIAGRIAVADIPVEELAEAMGCKRATAYARLKQPIEEWPFGQVIAACRCLGITSDELREKIRV